MDQDKEERARAYCCKKGATAGNLHEKGNTSTKVGEKKRERDQRGEAITQPNYTACPKNLLFQRRERKKEAERPIDLTPALLGAPFSEATPINLDLSTLSGEREMGLSPE